MVLPLSYELLFQQTLDKWGEELFPEEGDRKARRDDILAYFAAISPEERIPEDFDAFLQAEDIPLLLGIALDDDLYNSDQRNYCYLALAALRCHADPELLPALIIWLIRETADEDGIPYEYDDIFIKIGPPAVDMLLQCARESSIDDLQDVFFSHAALASMQHNQYRRGDIITAIKHAVEERLAYPIVDLTQLLLTMLDLRPTDELAYFRDMYQPDTVDFGVFGDWEDIEIELGLRETRSTPKPDYPKLSFAFQQRLNAQRQALDDAYRASAQRVLPAKIGVNDACPCGSGKKYKKCCLKKADNPFAR